MASDLSKNRLMVGVAAAAMFLLTALGGRSAEAFFRAPQRIISLAPSTTEIVFALGLGDRLVGVTRYCDYPPAATNIAKVGGYVDPSYEAMVALEPDLSILLSTHRGAGVRPSRGRGQTVEKASF